MVAFSPRKADLTLYVSARKAPKPLLKQLGKHKVSGSCLHIKRLSGVYPGWGGAGGGGGGEGFQVGGRGSRGEAAGGDGGERGVGAWGVMGGA